MTFVKIQQLPTGQYNITLPRNIVESMSWGKGDRVEILMAGKDKLELKRRLLGDNNGN